MSITDIIRGDDHLTNSFRQLEIFKFMNYKPNFSHMSLIHNEKNEKLSKRDNVLSIEDYKQKGFLKESLINYMLRMDGPLEIRKLFLLMTRLKILLWKKYLNPQQR